MRKNIIDVDTSDIGILRFMVQALYDGDCDGLAVRLIKRFGSVPEVFSATTEELMTMRGITERAASFFTSVHGILRQALLRDLSDDRFDSEAVVARYAAAYFMNERSTADICICLDKHNKRIATERLSPNVSAREIVSFACRNGAEKLIWLSYRPNRSERKGISVERAEAVRDLLLPLSALNIELVDYIEYTPFVLYSLRRVLTGDMSPITIDKASTEDYAVSDRDEMRIDAYIDMLRG